MRAIIEYDDGVPSTTIKQVSEVLQDVVYAIRAQADDQHSDGNIRIKGGWVVGCWEVDPS